MTQAFVSTRIRLTAEAESVSACEGALDAAFDEIDESLRPGRNPEVTQYFRSRTRADGTVVEGLRIVKFAGPLGKRIADTDQLLERLRSYAGVGIGISPLIQHTPDSPAWTVHVALDDGEDPHDFRGRTLHDAADNALAYVEEQQPR